MVKYFLKLDATFFIHESAELLSANKLFLKLEVENLLNLWYLTLKHTNNSKLHTFKNHVT
jgi:hypothetical protein